MSFIHIDTKSKYTNKYYLLILALSLLLPTFPVLAQSNETIVIGTEINQLPALPEKVKISSTEVLVTWEKIAPELFKKTFEKVIVKGKADKKDISATVWVLPENLVYLIDLGRISPNKSQIFDAAKSLRKELLLNEQPDKKYISETNKWGYIGQGIYLTQGNEDDWATSFITKDKENKNALIYKLTLQPGTYKITVAYVPSIKQSFASWLRVNNARINTQSVATTVSDDKIHPPVFISHDLRLIKPTTITYETDRLAGQFWENASISLIAVEQTSSSIAAPNYPSAGGNFWDSQKLTLTHKDANTEIYYTLDGSKPDKNSLKYSAPVKIDKTTRVSAIAYVGNEKSKVVTADFAINLWAVTATSFKLFGKNEVNNVKINWIQRKDADKYKIYRDGKLIGETKGDTYDDYDLAADKTYSYHVEAYQGESKMASAISQQATTFSPTGEVSVYDNKNGKYLSESKIEKPSGFKIGNLYFSYKCEKNDENWIISERFSKTGLKGSWSTPRKLASYPPNVKFEGIGFQYNKKTNKVVISAHYEDQDGYTAAKIYLAQVSPKGELEIGTIDRPLGYDSRDQSLFVDDDGSAYLLSATRTNNDINIYRLDESWTKPVSLINTIFIGQHRETPSIIKKDGKYYFFSSKASGWYPSQAMYASSIALDGVWTSLREIGNSSTFGAQSNSIWKYGTNKQTFGLWSYHWGAQYRHKDPDGNFPRISDISFNEGYASMDYYRYLEFHDEYGIIPVQNGKNLTLNCPATATVASSKEGNAACITDGASLNSSCYFQGGSYPYSLTIDMQKEAKISEINLSTKLVNGSETAYQYTIEGSSDGVNYKVLVDGKDNWQVGFQILPIEEQANYRYLRLNVFRIINVHNNNSATWADGVYELAAYGTPQ
ncbi:chitobiase/beta-hexosaminidase C-terminal domain-containing protein [Dysgonomonas sp. GY75]|uniref:FN3 associated domain-containing protein n=1 Tax=Dysgonomonas sp. GY75 TaxID=2780419 RepID=UPI00188347ED|nr:FN3 associated domain-containing protein [Dysgonomonas sp. GY75]MBF0648208.1 chitobiase/beta-hexosaminidase C-terminal domain-containing protein [Dysgonomonas sp. GY75]